MPSLTFTLTSIATLFRNAFQRAILQPPVKTAPRTGMAGGTGRFHLHPDRILIAVDKQFDQLLDVAGRSALVPNFASGSRPVVRLAGRSEEHTSELQSLMRISYAVFCLKKKK